MAYCPYTLIDVAADTVGHPYVNAISGGPYRSHAQRHKGSENYQDVFNFLGVRDWRAPVNPLTADCVDALSVRPISGITRPVQIYGNPFQKYGDQYDVDWLLISADFPDTYLTPWLTRIRAEDTERVSDVKQDATPAQGG